MSLHKKLSGLILFLIVTLTPSIYAQDACGSLVGNLIAFSNCGFQNNNTGGWQVVPGSLALSSSLPSSPAGNPYGVITPSGNNYDVRSPSFTLQAGATYSVTLLMSSISGSVTLGQIGFINTSGSIQSIISSNLLVPSFAWSTFSFTNLAIPVTDTYRLFVNSVGRPTTNTLGIDSVRIVQLTVPVPEPATMILLGSLCSAVVGYKYRRKLV
jgi:hypothetical protein